MTATAKHLSIIPAHYGFKGPIMYAVYSKEDKSLVLPGYTDQEEAKEACEGLTVFFGDGFYVDIQQ
jgi:hypothetical protein